jgi:single-strand DNA-binding protein
MSFNQVILTGRMGSDLEIRTLNNSKRVGNFRLATTSRSGGNTYTEWHQIAVYNEGLIKLFEKYTAKGDLIQVTGSIRNKEWEKDGVKRYSYEIAMGGDAQLVFLSTKKKSDDAEREPGSEG